MGAVFSVYVNSFIDACVCVCLCCFCLFNINVSVYVLIALKLLLKFLLFIKYPCLCIYLAIFYLNSPFKYENFKRNIVVESDELILLLIETHQHTLIYVTIKCLTITAGARVRLWTKWCPGV